MKKIRQIILWATSFILGAFIFLLIILLGEALLPTGLPASPESWTFPVVAVITLTTWYFLIRPFTKP